MHNNRSSESHILNCLGSKLRANFLFASSVVLVIWLQLNCSKREEHWNIGNLKNQNQDVLQDAVLLARGGATPY